jgi:uncharacterized damage-inducible protein DinB
MTLDEIRQLFSYNAWATRRIFEALETAPLETCMKDVGSSHGGIHGTLVHVVGAEKIWLSRWVGRPEATLLSPQDAASLSELKKIWEDVTGGIEKFLAAFDEKDLKSTFSHKTAAGKEHTHVFQHAFQHVVNHSSYHRGQITAMMRQAGLKPVNTDLMGYFRSLPGGRA